MHPFLSIHYILPREECERGLGSYVDVLDKKLCRGPVGRACDPHVEVLVLACLEIERAIAAAHFCNFVYYHRAVLALELRVFGAMRQQLENVKHQVAKAMRDAWISLIHSC